MIHPAKHPARIIPFDLYDISDFIVDEHPQYHPLYEQDLRDEYWANYVNKCLKGVWGHDYDEEKDKGGYRFCPGNLYFYINTTQILDEEEEGVEVWKRPKLRDIEWFLFYALMECDGFSGFKNDDKYTCYRPVGKLQGKITDSNGKKIELTHKEKKRLKDDRGIKKENGDYKEYIEPKELLYKTYDEPMGRPMFHNEMKNLVVLSSRGVGKSYSVANGVVLYDFVFGSARNFEEFSKRDKPSTIVVGAWQSGKTKELLKKTVRSYEYIKENIGTHPDVSYKEEPCPIFQSYREGSVLEPGGVMTNRTPQEGSGTGFEGTGSQIVNVTYYNNHQAGVSYRSRRMVVEEAGMLKNFRKVHGANAGSQKRSSKIGYTIYIGTGGDMDAIQGIRDAFYNPEAYNCVGFDDVFTNKPGKIGLFIPAYYRVWDYKNDLGNTEYQKAFEDELTERERTLKQSKSRYETDRVWYPIVPSEMFLNDAVNPFPTDLLDKRLTELETGVWDEIAEPVRMFYTNNENTRAFYERVPKHKANIIKRYRDEEKMTDEELKGCPVIYEHPKDSKVDFHLQHYRYIVTYDSVRDEDGGPSLACVQVWKFWELENMERVQYNLVAEWLGRHIGEAGMDKDHEIAFKFASYYNCPIFPEINVKDVVRHARMTNRYWMLMPKPGVALGDMNVNATANYKVGFKIVKGMYADLERYLNEAFLKSVDSQHILDGDDEIYKDVRMIEQCPSMRLIEEAMYYNRDENFDSISSAMLFGLISRQRENEPQREESLNDIKESEENFKDFVNDMSGIDEVSTNSAFNW